MANTNTKNQGRPFTVIVGVDYSDLSALALVEAVRAAHSRERSEVHVVHAVPAVQTAATLPGAPFVVSAVDASQAPGELKKFVERVLAESQATLPDDGKPLFERLTTHVGFSDPRGTIVQLATDLEADLIVIGTHGRRGMSRLLLGSVAEGVVRLAPCPVLVVRPRGTAASETIRIEPPCPQCVEARRATEGKEFWCSQHRDHHDRRHTYHFGPVRSGHQSGLLIPLFR